MLLFHPEIDKEGTNLYFDLDVTIDREITDIDKFITADKLTSVYCYWKPIDWERQAYGAADFNPRQ